MTVLPSERGGFGEPSNAFLRYSHWLYLEEWKRAGRRRLYLTDSAGAALGWKNLADGVIAVTAEGQETMTRAILSGASVSGLNLPRESVPRLAVEGRAGALVSAVTRVYKTIHVARHWRKGAAERLYCTAADPTDGVYDLGYVDLLTGSVHPESCHPAEGLGIRGAAVDLDPAEKARPRLIFCPPASRPKRSTKSCS